jgi:hypothetical protein
MKNLFHIFIIFVLSFFYIIDESKATIPDVMLKCEPIIWGTLDNPYRVELTKFYKLNKDSDQGKYYIFSERDQKVKVSEFEINVFETQDMKQIYYFSESLGELITIDRETLIRSTEKSQDQCYVLSTVKTIEEYLQEHKRLYQSLLDNEISNQLRKNKI